MRKWIWAALLPLAGCAANSGVVSMGTDSYFITKQAATGFSGIGNLKGEALAEAGAKCGAVNKKVVVTNMTEAQPPYIFGNYPRVEVMFDCK